MGRWGLCDKASVRLVLDSVKFGLLTLVDSSVILMPWVHVTHLLILLPPKTLFIQASSLWV
jgi:hypothetical protein